MLDPILVFVALVFALAGAVKGVVGLGLPTIAMGLLATAMTPVQAAAILLLPSFVTNVWQMIAGPALGIVLRRLWSMLLASCVATWVGRGLMTGASAQHGTALLGAALALYATTGFVRLELSVPKSWETVLSPVVGAMTGLVTAATGVFVLPAVPYMQAIGLEKEALVQALGLSFTVSTLALAVNIGAAGGFDITLGAKAMTGLLFACAGMWFGQLVRRRLSPGGFRQWFFAGLFSLGVYLLARPLI
ncbi:MAG: sulfite exporter TauE/SafE family protein [Hyphomicrobiaceae bacterium]